MKKLHKYRSVFWLLPLLIFCCTCFSGIYASGELFLVSAAMLPFSVWIAIVSSFRRNDFLFYPSVIFLSLLQFWPLFSYSAWRVMVLLFAAMLVLCVILCGRVWIILHSIILWLYGALLISIFYICQQFGMAFGAPRNPWLDRGMWIILFAPIGGILVRFAIRNILDRREQDHHGSLD